MPTRRDILKSAVAPMIVPSVVLGQRAGAVAPSDKVVLGGIGIGARGQHVLSKFLVLPDARFIAVCDVRNERREEIKTMVDKAYGTRDCQMYGDQYELLARQDVDAVLIATGDRWHTPLSIIAAQHGKDVYCEKPCSMSMEESWALADAFKRYNRLYQAGCQRRNGANFELCKELLRSGALGKLQALYANVGPSVNWPPLPSRDWLAAEELPPKQLLDWDRWLGPAPWRPYNSEYVRGGWRNYYDFHGGGILEWGSHTVDLCHWAANLDDTQPLEYEPEGTNVGPYFVHCKYSNGVKLVMRDNGWDGALKTGSCSFRIEGDQGWVETGDLTKIECSENIKPLLRPTEAASLALANHVVDFVKCVKSRQTPRASAAAAANSHIACHAAFIAYQRGKKLEWDPLKRQFANDDVANNMRSRALREPWRV
ncbi:MAG: Gfo/Idh/MocA family oxidoreductase [Bryobacteraceae bacterium]|nr:Gfo/Idh/MocA family oxidoreductase [Bryobacteraceae bacterium]